MGWIASQLGSREHYAVPAGLHGVGRLRGLLTDLWVPGWARPIVKRLVPASASRGTDRIPDTLVRHATGGRLLVDAKLRAGKLTPWRACVERNRWYSSWVGRCLGRMEARVFFSYSYAARVGLQAAKRQGMRCILGQIDMAWREEQIVRELAHDYLHLESEVGPAPEEYWESWREEIELADKIVVNSLWSANLLVEAGVPAAKLVEIPLVYEPSGSMDHGAESMEREEEKLKNGNAKRLKALFLGSVILRKGVGQLFDAIRMLKNEPVDFTFAGPIGVKIPNEISGMSNVRFLGPVDKAATERLYRQADVFLFPTLSDGFGLTQLEALGHGLPVIASMNCGQVSEDGINGLVLPEISPEAIAEAIMRLVRDRELLAKLKLGARVPDRFHPRHLAPALLALEA